MMKTANTAMLTLAGCAAACAGIAVVPTLLAGAALGGVLMSGEVGLALAVLVASLGGWYLLSRQKAAKGCHCAPESGCNSGNSCDLPDGKPDA
jgi:FtsH-binding integral membrane protein